MGFGRDDCLCECEQPQTEQQDCRCIDLQQECNEDKYEQLTHNLLVDKKQLQNKYCEMERFYVNQINNLKQQTIKESKRILEAQLQVQEQQFMKDKHHLFHVIEQKDVCIAQLNRELEHKDKLLQQKEHERQQMQRQRDHMKSELQKIMNIYKNDMTRMQQKCIEINKQTQTKMLEAMKYRLNAKINNLVETIKEYCRDQIGFKNRMAAKLRNAEKQIKVLNNRITELQSRSKRNIETMSASHQQAIQDLKDKLQAKQSKVDQLKVHLEQNKLQPKDKDIQIKEKVVVKEVEVIKEVPVEKIVEKEVDHKQYKEQICRLKLKLKKLEDLQIEHLLMNEHQSSLNHKMNEYMGKNNENERTIKRNEHEIDDLHSQIAQLRNKNHEQQDLIARLQFQVNAVNSQNGELNTILNKQDADLQYAQRQIQKKNRAGCCHDDLRKDHRKNDDHQYHKVMSRR